MTSINIGGNSNDIYYRYKRDIITITSINKQGGLTEITNIESIRRQLQVPDEFVNKFYKNIKKLGKSMVKPGVIRGDISVKELEKILEKMIIKYVLCPKCKLPEWDREVCNACGFRNGVTEEKEKKGKILPISNLIETNNINNKSIMIQLYDKRDELKSLGEDISEIDNLIDRRWANTNVV